MLVFFAEKGNTISIAFKFFIVVNFITGSGAFPYKCYFTNMMNN